MNEGTHLVVRVQSAFGCSAEKSPTKRPLILFLFNITFLYDIPAQNIACKQYDSTDQKFACPSILLLSVLNYILRGLGAPQGHHNVHTGFVTIGHTVQKIECYGQTHYGIRTMWRFRCLDFRKLSFAEVQSLCCLYYRTVCVCLLASSVERADRMSRHMTSYIWRPPNHDRFQFPTVSKNNMADKRFCEAVATQASLTWRKSMLMALK